MTLKKPSDLFKRQNSLITEDYCPFPIESGRSDMSGKIDMSIGLTETFDRFKNNLEKIDELTEQVQSLSEEIESKLTKKDLENAMISHLMVVNENFKVIQDQVRGVNKTDLNKFNKGLNEVVHIVDNLVSVEIPKYNKKLAGSEFAIENKFINFKDDISDKINQYHSIIDEFKKTIDESHELRNEIQTELTSVKEIKETVEKYTDRIDEFQHTNNSQLRKVENFILKNHNHIVELKKEVFNEIGKLSLEDINENIGRIENKIKYIENVYNSINAESLIGESLLSEPPQTENGDPLTPLDRKFITQKDLQNHYRLFINRVQQQLATIGGGGETQLKYLDDIVGIATNASAYDGKVLSYNHSLRKFEFIPNESGNAVITISDTIPPDPEHGDLWYDSTIGRTFIYYVDVDGPQWVDAAPSGGLTYPVFWTQTNAGIHTLSNVGIGTTSPQAKFHSYGIDNTLSTVLGAQTNTLIEVNNDNPWSIGFRRTDLGPTADVAAWIDDNRNFLIASGLPNGGFRYSVGLHTEYVKLYAYDQEKFSTLGAGATVIGTLFANQLSISGISTFNADVNIGGGLTVSGNIVGTSATFTPVDTDKPVVSIASSTSIDPTNFGILGVGRTIGFSDTNIIAHFADNVDGYSQVIIQNHSKGTQSSADFIVNNDQELGTQYYGDFGINGGSYEEDPENPFSEPNGVYLYSTGGSLTIGCENQVPIKFVVNFTEIARFVEEGFGIGTTQPTSKLTVDGDVFITGISTFNTDVNIDGGLIVSGISSFTSDVSCSNLQVNDTLTVNTIISSGNLIKDNAENDVITFDGSGNTAINGDLTLIGNKIKDSNDNTAITFDGAGNTTVEGKLYPADNIIFGQHQKSVILVSPNGSKFRLDVNNAGQLTTTLVF